MIAHLALQDPSIESLLFSQSDITRGELEPTGAQAASLPHVFTIGCGEPEHKAPPLLRLGLGMWT